MFLKCSKCAVVLTEEGPEEEAVPELVRRLNRHFARRHPKTVERIDEEIQELQLVVDAYIRLSEYAEADEVGEVSPLTRVLEQLYQKLGEDLDFLEEEEEKEGIEEIAEIEEIGSSNNNEDNDDVA